MQTSLSLTMLKLTASPELAVAFAVAVPPTAKLAGMKLIGLMAWLAACAALGNTMASARPRSKARAGDSFMAAAFLCFFSPQGVAALAGILPAGRKSAEPFRDTGADLSYEIYSC